MGSVWDITPSLVQEKFDLCQGYANDAYATAFSTLQALSDLGGSLRPISFEPTFDEETFSLTHPQPTPPAAPTISVTLPPVPDVPTFENIVIDLPSIPEFNIADVLPNIPEIPQPVFPEPPNEPSLETIDYPTKPSYTLPTTPTFIEPSIPEPPNIEFPTFDAEPPVANLVVPDPVIDPANAMYESEFLDTIKTKLKDWIEKGGTGLSPEIETAIFNRDVERAQQELRDAIDRITAVWARSGFTLPNGKLAALIEEAEITFMNKRLEVSREIAIKQAELEQQNIHFAIEKGLGLEQALMTYANSVAQRTFEASKAVAEIAIHIFNAMVQKYNIEVEVYKARAAVYETRIKAEAAKADVYKAQMEGVKAIADVNESKAKAYMAMISAIEALTNIYKTEMQAAGIKADVQKTIIDAFRAQVEAYVAKINGETSKFNLYKAKIDGEMAKVNIYQAQVQAYSERVRATSAIADAKLGEARIKGEKNRDLVTQYQGQIEAFKAQMSHALALIDAELKKYQVAGEVYRTQGSIFESLAGVDVKVFDARIHQMVSETQIELEAARMAARNFEILNQLKIEAMKGAAQIAAQLVAGALSGVSASAQLGVHGQTTHYYDELKHINENYNYSK
jgi:hypothetical protein